MAGKIFINYRRALNPVEAQLLKKVLQRHFGKDGVFLDVSGLEGGEHWLHTLEAQVDASAAMVSLIPKGWADVRDESGARRLDNPHDFVRFEIARAFARKIPVLPLRLNGSHMPAHTDLPPNIAELGFMQGMLLRTESFDDDADKIAGKLKELVARRPGRGVPYWAAGAVAASALALGLAAGHWAQERLGLVAVEAVVKEAKTLAESLKGAQAAREAGEVRIADLTAKLELSKKQLAEIVSALEVANKRAASAEAGLLKPRPQQVAPAETAPAWNPFDR
jgi:hypothetical protein